MGKGSRRRQLGVDRAVFDTNWDKIFKKEKQLEAGKWEHMCKHNGATMLEDGAECQWCGAKKDD